MSTGTTPVLSPAAGYKEWAASYDHDRNPMLTLEQRILERLLPPLKGLDVVDLGCGTGRWLAAAKVGHARTLTGVDLSPEMLSQARAKLGKWARLVCGDYKTAFVPRQSADVIFCNFVLSYIEDAIQFLSFARDILRPGGSLFLTDVHPETAAALNWRRGVSVGRDFQTIHTYERSLEAVMALCEAGRFETRVRLELRFGEAERLIFAENGKRDYFDKICEYPAIYVLQLTATRKSRRLSKQQENITEVQGGRISIDPTDTVAAKLLFSGARVEAIHSVACTPDSSANEMAMNLDGYLLFPGFVNTHDHLEFALFPRMGNGAYRNFLEWAEDIHRSYVAEIARHRNVRKDVRLWWGGIRNLLCGVTTVCHHNPYDPGVFTKNFPVRVLRNFEWAHSLALDPKAVTKKRATRDGKLFFLHLAEGIDEPSAKEIFNLHQSAALDEDTVLIHGVGLDAKGKNLLRKSGAGLVWCPSSNLFLFGATLAAEELKSYGNVALGSDSPLTAQGDLLDEVSCAYGFMNAKAADLYEYITRNAAGLLRIPDVEGRFRVGAFADLVAMKDTDRSPAETLISSSYRDVELVMISGRVRLASTEMRNRLPEKLIEGLQPLWIDGVVRWIDAPLEWLFAETASRLGERICLGGKPIRFGT